jgi:hypothetical protein
LKCLSRKRQNFGYGRTSDGKEKEIMINWLINNI